MIALSIKAKNRNGEWETYPLQSLDGKTLREVMEAMDGQEAVAEFTSDGKKAYFCGTAKWLDYYGKMGYPARTFKAALEHLEKKRPELLQWTCPAEVKVALEIFEGSFVSEISIGASENSPSGEQKGT